MQKFIPVTWSVFSDDVSINPHKYLAPLYERNDIVGFQSEGLNFLFRYDDCKEFIFSKKVNQEHAMLESGLSEQDSEINYPNLTWYRQYNIVTSSDVSKKLSIRRFLRSLQEGDNKEAWLKGCDSLIRPALKQLDAHDTVIDFMQLFSTVPYRIITRTLGIEPNRAIEDQLHAAARVFIANWGKNERKSLEESDRSVGVFREHIDPLIERGSPLLRASSKEDNLTTDEISAILIFFLITSIDNIAITSAFMLINLLRHTDKHLLLKRQPSLADDAYMEFLRMDEHIKSVPRFIAIPFEYKGVSFEQGEMVNLFYPGANRDPNYWESPNTINLNRKFINGQHFLFGGGRHACIGIEIAHIFMPYILSCFIKYLPVHARLLEEEIQVNGEGLGERALEKVLIQV